MGEEEFKKGEFSMCQAFMDMKEEGRAEAREDGIHKVLNVIKKFHGSKEEAVAELREEYGLSRESAAEKVALYW